ncbi:MAG: putative Ig domain-containing protein, partial [Planctomycetes bacterium]|nr:putative Ig domain-containing protein [Planctomycetota bacterium]
MRRALLSLFALPLLLLAGCPSGSDGGGTSGPAPVSFGFLTAALPNATQNVAYLYPVQVQGGAQPVSYFWQAGYVPPAWLSLSSTGVLAGTPSGPGSYTLKLMATDASMPPKVANVELPLLVQAGALAITTTDLPAAVVSQTYSADVLATGGLAPYTYSVTSGGTAVSGGFKLGATNLVLDAAGHIGGSYTGTATELLLTFTVEVQDSSPVPVTDQRSYDLWVVSAPSVSTAALPRGTRNAGYASQLQAAVSVGAYPLAWSLTASSDPLPAGLALQADGTFYGTPTEGGLFELEVKVETDTVPVCTATRKLDLVVYEPIGYAHAPDRFDGGAGNNTMANATNLGALGMAAPLVEAEPLSVCADPADPATDPVDYFRFTTPFKGEILVEVFFDAFVGKVKPSLQVDNGGVVDELVGANPDLNTDDDLLVLPDAPAGTYYLKIAAYTKSGRYDENGYSFRVRFNELTINTDLIEFDRALSFSMNEQVPATLQGAALGGGNWSLATGALPGGVTFSSGGSFTGYPVELGLFDFTVQVSANSLTTSRVLRVRLYDSSQGDYWKRLGQHRFYDSAAANGNGTLQQLYMEGMVVAPHPAYGAEGAIYTLGGRRGSDTIDTVYVFHTDHQADANRDYKLEDISRPLSTPRQYVGAAFVQHSYGGYIYAVGGELYSSTSPSTGNYTRIVERMQVSDGSGNPLPAPGPWQAVAQLPSTLGGRAVQGWAEFGLVTVDSATDADERIYVVAGRVQIETTAGSGTYTKELSTSVLMFELPDGAAATGAWHIKSDAGAYTGRRFPLVGMINNRIYIAGGRTWSGTSDF